MIAYIHVIFKTYRFLTHWGRVTHICVSKLTIIGSDNGLAPGRRQTIIWTNDGILLIGPLGTNFSEILIGIQIFSFMKMHLKISSAKWRPFCLGLNVLTAEYHGEWVDAENNSDITCVLTHRGRDKMATIFQTTFSNGFSWMKMYEFLLEFHWSLFSRVQLTIFHYCFR